MKRFLDDNFLLETKTAQRLYYDYAKDMPIIDYHCHLPQAQIAEDKQFENLTQIWLYGDHYKWRAMRTNGVDESYCTGNQPDYAKFESGRKRFLTLCAIHCIIGHTSNCNVTLMYMIF
jgi:glucuronate isomerase